MWSFSFFLLLLFGGGGYDCIMVSYTEWVSRKGARAYPLLRPPRCFSLTDGEGGGEEKPTQRPKRNTNEGVRNMK